MSNTPAIRAALAKAALQFVPPLIRMTLFEDPGFRALYGANTDIIYTFRDAGLSIKRSELFDAVRKILAGTSEANILDTEGREWTLRKETVNDHLSRLVISANERRLVLPDFSGLASDSAIRLRFLDEAASEVNLPSSAQAEWRTILSERPLEDDEIDKFYGDFHNTPIDIARSIYSETKTGRSNISTLVPSSRKYYDKLIGAYDGSPDIKQYARGTGRQLFEQLSAWRRYEGFLFSLFLSSHSALTDEIDVEHLGSEDLVRAFEFLEKYGDPISQLGGIEIGLRILPDRPELETFIIRLVEQIRDDNIDSSDRGLKLLSALFILVDGELSRIRLMAVKDHDIPQRRFTIIPRLCY